MPSGSIVAVDPADNDAAVLDASACAAVASDAPPDGRVHRPNERVGVRVSQSQDDDGDEAKLVLAVVEHPKPAAARVSPMPPRRAKMVTPRSTAAGRRKSQKSAAGCSVDVAANANADADRDGGPATPRAIELPKNASGAVVVSDTPGESAKKRRGGKDNKGENDKAASAGKGRTTATLHSFFGRAGPPARRKTAGGKKKQVGGIGAPAAAKATSAAGTAPREDAKEAGAGDDASAERRTGPPVVEAAAEAGGKVAEGPASKEAADAAKAGRKAPKKVEADNVASPPTDDAPPAASAKPAQKASDPIAEESGNEPSKKAAKKSQLRVTTSAGERGDILDDPSPTYAVAVAMRTLSAGRPRNSGGRARRGVTVHAMKEVVELDADGDAEKKGAKNEATKEVDLTVDEDAKEMDAKEMDAVDDHPKVSEKVAVLSQAGEDAADAADAAEADAKDAVDLANEGCRDALEKGMLPPEPSNATTEKETVSEDEAIERAAPDEDLPDAAATGKAKEGDAPEAAAADVLVRPESAEIENDAGAGDAAVVEESEAAGETVPPPEGSENGARAAVPEGPNGRDVVSAKWEVGVASVDGCETAERAVPSTSEPTNADDVLDVDCEDREPVDEEDSKNDATVALEEFDAAEKSRIPSHVRLEAAEIDRPKDTIENWSGEKSNIESDDICAENTDDLKDGNFCEDNDSYDQPTNVQEHSHVSELPVTADVPKMSAPGEPPTEEPPTEEPPTEDQTANQVPDIASKISRHLPSPPLLDDVVIVDALRATANKSSSKRRVGTKVSLSNSRKKAVVSSGKSSGKKKAPAVPGKRREVSPLAASFEKMAACPPKKSKAPLSKSKPPLSRASSTAPLKSTLNNSTDKAASEKKASSLIVASLKKLESSPQKKKKPFSKSKTRSSDAKSNSKSTTTVLKAVNKADAGANAPAPNLLEEDVSRLRNYAGLREKYVARATELSDRPLSDDFEEESLSLASAEGVAELEDGSVAEDGAFPDVLLTHLLLIVQGR